MSFTSKEKVSDYLYKVLNQFKGTDFKDIVPEYFDISFTLLEKGLIQRKLKKISKNYAEVLMLELQRAKWSIQKILSAAFELELEHMIKHSTRFEWVAHKFIGTSKQEEISDFSELIRLEIRKNKKDALVLVKKVESFFWISVIMKNLKLVGIYEKPRYAVVSSEGRYFFIKDGRSNLLIEYLTSTLGYEKCKKVRLCGKSLPTLLKLLQRKEKVDMKQRPIFEGKKTVETEHGLDFTQKENYYDYFDKCVDGNDINLQKYTITSQNCPWLGDDNPILKEMEFKSAITLNGDVARIIKHLPVASIVKPPIPNYLRNFSVAGRNAISLKSQNEQSIM